MNLQSIGLTIQVLQDQLNVYRTLLDLSRRKQEVLVKGGTAQFEAIVESEQALLWQAGRLEERRLGLQAQIAIDMGLVTEDVTVTRIAPYVPQPERDQLRTLQADILKVLAELGEVNEVNTRLIKQSLAYINAALHLITSAGQRPVTYTPRGQTLPVAERLKVLNQKV